MLLHQIVTLMFLLHYHLLYCDIIFIIIPNTIILHRLPTDVQAEAVPLILGGGDVLMAAETGSGQYFLFFFSTHILCLFFF